MPKTTFISNQGTSSAVKTTGVWTTRFGGSLSSYFKPFTTATGLLNDGAGFPKFMAPLQHPCVILQSGMANSSGLNPFGRETLFEGHIYGNDVPNTFQFDSSIDRNTVRSHGIKNPMILVGWGFDTFGWPAPNAISGYAISGVFGSILPTGRFASGAYSNTNGAGVANGFEVPQANWLAGPLDLRWDIIRKVWTTNNNGIFAAIITAVYASGIGGANYYVPITAQGYRDSGFLPYQLRYDAETFDGMASKIKVTGVRPIGPQIPAWNARRKPLMPGYPCQIQQCMNNGRLAYGIWGLEPDFLTDCNNVVQTIS